MRWRYLAGVITLAATLLGQAPSHAALNRAGDPNAPPLPVVFKPGQTCWRYSGKEAYFTGNFKASEHIIVTSAGEAHFSDPSTGREIVRVAMREVTVLQQASPYRVLKEIAEGEYVIPVTGAYDITFWPHAVQGFPGVMIVCKR